jgi:hypothetical protein
MVTLEETMLKIGDAIFIEYFPLTIVLLPLFFVLLELFRVTRIKEREIAIE